MALTLLNAGKYLPTNYIVDPQARFYPGQIGRLALMSGSTVGTLCHGDDPIGIIDDVHSVLNGSLMSSVHRSGRVTIWNVQGLEFETDQFEPGYIFATPSKLYCSTSGRFAPTPPFSHSIKVADLLPSPNPGLIRAKWSLGSSTYSSAGSPVSSGANCHKCNDYYEFGQPNQPDGTYKCWGCRNGYN